MRFGWIVPLTLAIACVALPSFVPVAVQIGGYSFRLYEPLLIASAVWALTLPHSKIRTARYSLPFIAVTILASLNGYFGGLALPRVVSDTRQLAFFVLALVVTSRIIGTPVERWCILSVRWVLWISAVMILLSSAFGIELAGRSEVATLQYGSTEGATRLLTPATYLAVVTVCICIALITTGRVRLAAQWTWLVPALLIVILAFSRNHLLAFGIAGAFALIAARSSRSVASSLRAGVVVACVLTALSFGLSNALYGLPGIGFVASQIDSYSSRVIDGLNPQELDRDGSVLFREEENYFMDKSIEEAPVAGNGYGFAYKPKYGEVGSFTREVAPYYGHNFYLWTMVKSGVIGLLAFLWMVALPLAQAMVRPGTSSRIAAASAGAGLLAVSFVAPMPNGSPTALLFGAVIGAVIALKPVRNGESVHSSTGEIQATHI
tara:strand:- start:12 stop:1316 length:1305 start_codon:yes stop_codon:yes gene_type:complete